MLQDLPFPVVRDFVLRRAAALDGYKGAPVRCLAPPVRASPRCTGMLTNLIKLPINRIHNSLEMFMSGGDKKYETSLPELQQLLWHLCSEGKLEQVDGEYRLVKH